MADEQQRPISRIGEPVDIASALEQLLNLIEQRSEPDEPLLAAERILPLSTGRVYMDRLLGGGLRPRTVTVLEADTADLARPLLIDVAVHSDAPTLLAAHGLLWETALMWGAAARVSKRDFASGTLDETTLSRLNEVIGGLAERRLWVTETVRLEALRAGVRDHGIEILLFDDLGRLEHPSRALSWLVALAVECEVAVVATSKSLAPDDLRGGEQLVRVVVAHAEGRSTLVRADGLDMLRIEDVLVDHASGLVN